MNTKPPATRTLVVLAAFLVSCVSLTLFLWLTFGGRIPLAPDGYRIRVPFPYAAQLVEGADVRIAGVNIGKTVGVSLDRHTNRTIATLELGAQYSPRPADTRAVLRQKTALGEIYIELTPGSPRAPKLPDGAMLPAGQVARTVNFDEVLRTFDRPTRRALSALLAEQGAAVNGAAPSFSAFVYELDPFAVSGAAALHVVRTETAATQQLVRDGGAALGAVGRSRSALQDLITGGDQAFGATARRSAELAAAVRALPAFLVATRQTIQRITRTAQGAMPLVLQLQPAAGQLAPALQQLSIVAPSLRRLLVGVGPLAGASNAGFPAFERALNDSQPLLARAKPYLGGLVPVINYLGVYRREIAMFLGNMTAATQQSLPGNSNPGLSALHVVRASLPIDVESLGAYPSRIATDRVNPYPKPGAAGSLYTGLPTFGSYLCQTRPLPSLGTAIPSDLRTTLYNSYFLDTPKNSRPPSELAPACRDQGPLGPATGAGSGTFPRLTPLP